MSNYTLNNHHKIIGENLNYAIDYCKAIGIEYRIIVPHGLLTADYKEHRMNIIVDADHVVLDYYFG